MKIIICTTPIRPYPTDYPPFGSMAMIQALRAEGYHPYFYDIDCLRPSFDQVLQFIRSEKPDIVGISAVVSTAYAHTKRLALGIKELLPETKIVLGGNLAASPEIVLRFCKIDYCVIGEGERIIVNLVRYLERHPYRNDYTELERIRGLAYLNQNGQMVFTGYEIQIPAQELLTPDFSILEKFSRIESFITDPLTRTDFAQDHRTYESHRRHKKMSTVVSAKGCVARCTFCHRWDKGYRHLPVEKVISSIRYLMDRYNVGFFMFGDENFGSDRRKLEELITQIKPLDILYQVGGMRCRSVDLDLLNKMKDSGCVAVYYGMETGSPRMLQVMEKNTELEHNVQAALWTHEVGLYTIYQLVLGMPGETPETISETIEFVKRVTEFLDEAPKEKLSMNYIQALPGTPVYERARQKGLIGSTLEDEEAYLLNVSDIDAVDDTKFINFTDYDYLTVQSWRAKLHFEVGYHYYKKRNWKPARTFQGARVNSEGELVKPLWDYDRGGYFNLIHRALPLSPLFFRYCYPFRNFFIMAHFLLHDLRGLPLRRFMYYLFKFFYSRLKKRARFAEYRSLRKVVADSTSQAESKNAMAPLRAGR